MRKVLYSPGFGAGWASWAGGGDSPGLIPFMLEYAPLIEALEADPGVDLWNGNPELEMSWKDRPGLYGFAEDGNTYILHEAQLAKVHPALAQFVREVLDKFGTIPYLGGVGQLSVATGNGRVRIDEYDGSESVNWEGDSYDDWY